LSNGADVEDVTQEAVTQYLEAAAEPGLETSADPYTLAHDFTSMLQTALFAISKAPMLSLEPGGSIILTPTLKWELSASCDESGALHRWVTVDKLDEDAISRLLHSWAVFGDVAAAGVPMVLHVVEIGNRRNGRQHSPWCKAYRHPAIAGRFAFQKQDGSPLTGDWKAVWYQDSDRNRPDSWVELMERDGVSLIHEIRVKQVSQVNTEAFLQQVAAESERMKSLADVPWTDIPMSRPACDAIGSPCGWQHKCYT
jgi:hypothetical protein